MPTQEYYNRLRETANRNIEAAAQSRDFPTVDQWSSGYNGERHVTSAAEALHEIDCAEEQGMTLTGYRNSCRAYEAEQAKLEAYWQSPEYAAKQRQEKKDRQAAVQANLSTDRRVAQAVYVHWNWTGPITIDYFGESANVRQKIGGKPHKCRVDLATMTITDM